MLAAAPNLSIRSARWIAPSSDPAQVLANRPVECLAKPADPETAYAVEVGRAAFRDPLVLGGQAARAGLACDSCHRNGRTNPDFFFPGLSGAPGTADVTSSLFSRKRGDGIDNPIPIPDLGGSPEKLKVSRDPAKPDLEAFIHGLAVDEFDGAEPPPAVLKGLAAYVRNLSPAACPAAATEPVRVAQAIAAARRAIAAAQAALARNDPATAVVMVEAARSALGMIYERYDAPELAAERDALKAADFDLSVTLDGIRAGDQRAGKALGVWTSSSSKWIHLVQHDERKSLYDPRVLAAAAGTR